MLLTDFFEDARTDIDIRSFVNSICSRIMAKIYDGTQPDVHANFRGGHEYFVFYPTTLGVAQALPNTMIALTLRKGREVTGQLAQFKSDVCGGGYLQWIALDCLDAMDAASLRSSGGSTRVASTLKHELTHVVDDMRTNNKIGRDYVSPDNSVAKYYNSGSEFNAYYHDIAGDFASVAHDVSVSKTYEDAMEVMDLYGFTGQMREDLVTILSKAHADRKGFMKWISDKNQKKLLRRLYQLHTEIMSRIDALPSRS